MAGKPKDLTGIRFGRLVAVNPTVERKRACVVWDCVCDCGNRHKVISSSLLSGHTKSCGCLGLETQLKQGEHWRKEKPYWNRDWLYREYIARQKSSEEIAEIFGVHRNAIFHWLRKHNIQRRSTSETRAVKHWGLSGEQNGMFGKTGKESPNWKGGITPERQDFYASEEWLSIVPFVWQRDKAQCQRCKAKQAEKEDTFHIHHIVSFAVVELRAELSNLILLCKECHHWVHSRKNKKGLFISGS